MHAIIGLYLWEFVTSLDFEWDLITRRKSFKWPLVRPPHRSRFRNITDVFRNRCSTLLAATASWEPSSECKRICDEAVVSPLTFCIVLRVSILHRMCSMFSACQCPHLYPRPTVNCQALYSYNQFMGDAAVGFASINLALRVIAIYKQDKRVIAVLVLAILGQ
jgi:hypothetical protein